MLFPQLFLSGVKVADFALRHTTLRFFLAEVPTLRAPPPLHLMICGVTRSGIDLQWTYFQDVTVTEVHYTQWIDCSIHMRHT